MARFIRDLIFVVQAEYDGNFAVLKPRNTTDKERFILKVDQGGSLDIQMHPGETVRCRIETT